MGYQQHGNQKVVIIHKTEIHDGDLYVRHKMDVAQKAMQELDGGEFKLWYYFSKNKDDWEFALSSADAERNWGISRKQYNRAVDNLIQKGYLVCVNEQKRIYDFYECGTSLAPKVTIEDNKEDLAPKVTITCTQTVQGNVPKGNKDLLPKVPTNNIYNINNINNISDSSQEESEYSDAVAAALRMNGLL